MKARACIGLFVSWSLSQFPSSFADDAPISPAAENATMIPIETPSPSEWLLGINSTETVCVSNIFGGLTCNTETRVTAPDGEYSDMAISVDCANKDTTDFRSNHSKCTCSVVLLDDQGRIKSGCSCDICPFGYGRSPVIVDCQEDFIVAQCTSIDCDHGCNGACESDCTLSGSECTLPCQDSQFTSTTAPTSLFLDTNETFIQTVPPSIMSNETLSPTTVDNETETLAPTTSLDFNETDVPTLAPSVTEGTVLGDNETETLAPTEVLNTTLLDTNETNRFAPTVPPTSINGTLLGNNGTDTLIPTPSPNMTFPGANETETFEPKIPPTGINGTLRGDNETETLSPFPNVTLPDTNETEILPPTAPPTGINVNSPGDNETETLVPSTIPNSTLPDTNETESNVPTLAPTIINGTDNETGTSIPTEAPNMTLPDTNEIETSAPTISPNATLPDTNQTGAPTVSPKATLPDANETKTNAPTVSPNATLPNANETETNAPTVSPNATLPDTNGLETNAPTVAPNSTFLDSEDGNTTMPTMAPTGALIPESDDDDTAAPSIAPNVSLPGTPTLSPSVSDAAETMAPVALPSTVPTPLPSTPPTTTPAVETKSEVQVYEFTGISMRLTGVGLTPLTAETKTVFEAVTEDFYRNAYRSARARRRLQFVESFDTDVTVIRDRVDSTGNTITYDQTLSFTAEMGSLDEIFAADILLVPLSGKELQQIYLQALKTGNEAFGGVTAVTTPSLPEPNFTVEEDSGEIDMLLLIFITIGGVLLFGACFVAIVLVRRCSGDGGDPIRDGDKKGEQDKYLEDEYMYGNPNDRISQLNDPFIDEIGRAPEKRDRSDRSADDFFLDPSENVGGDEDGRGEVFNDETESGRHRGREDRSFGLGGVSRRHQGRTEDDSSNGSDTDSRSGSSSGLGSTDHYGDSGSESGSGSYSGSDSSSSEDGTNFQ